jgi:hypothetical protein
MGMNIKDLQVHAMAKELARSPSPEAPEAIEARKAAIRAICARTSARPEWQGRTSQELQDALYDEHGLPV